MAQRVVPLFICLFMMFNSRYSGLSFSQNDIRRPITQFSRLGYSGRLIYYLKDIRIIKHFAGTGQSGTHVWGKKFRCGDFKEIDPSA